MTIFRGKAGDVEIEGLAGPEGAGDSLENHAPPREDVASLERCGSSQEHLGFFMASDDPAVLRSTHLTFDDFKAGRVST